MPSYDLDWNNFNSATAINTVDKTLPDQIFGDTILLDRLYKNAKFIDGGDQYTVPVEYGTSPVGTYEKFGTHTVQHTEKFTTARFNPGQYYTYVTIAKDDFDNNNGTPKIFDLVQASYQNALNTLEDNISADLYRDGTTSVTGSKCIVGLKAAVADTPTAGIYGGIDRSTETWWRNQYWAYTGSLGAFDQYDVNKFLLDCNGRKDRVDLMVTTKTIWQQLYEKADTNMRMPWKLAYDLGIQSMNVGGVPVIYDDDVPAGSFYCLNTKYLYFVALKNNNFKAGQWIMQQGQFAQTKYVTTTLQLVCTKPRRQGVITSIS